MEEKGNNEINDKKVSGPEDFIGLKLP